MRIDPNLIIKTLKTLGLNAYATAQKLGIHPAIVYRWKRSAKTFHSKNYYRHTGLRRKSTRPHTVRPHVLDVQERISLKETGTPEVVSVAAVEL